MTYYVLCKLLHACQVEDNWGGEGGGNNIIFTDKIINYPESDSSLP